ncbi:MAG: type II toxin-antitoxin system RelE/ParE family toxin [bacterium]
MNQNAKNLGTRFINELDSVFEKIQNAPQKYNQIHKNIRRALCLRFPYSIYFINNNPDILVIAVLHQRRNPVYWQNRLQQNQ